MATYAMPDFWLGMLLLTALAVGLGWFPVGGIVDPNSDATGVAKLADQAKHMFLPALTLTLAYLGEYALVMRSSLLETMREDYLVLARAKGLRDIVVRNRHAVPNALLPVVTLIAINFGFVLSGAIAVEAIFSWPGLGLATYDALQGPDLPMLQGLFLVFSARRDRRQPARRPALRLPRPAGAHRMSSVAVLGPADHLAAAPARGRRRVARVPPSHPGDGRPGAPRPRRGDGARPPRCWPTPPACTRSTRPPTRRGPTRRSSARWAPTTSGAA